MQFVRKVGKRGSLTLPIELREALAIDEGDIVEFRLLSVHREGRKHMPGEASSVSGAAPA